MDRSHGCAGASRPIPESPLSSTSTLSETGRKRALLVGICTARSEGYLDLKAAQSDVDKMRALLIDIYHYAPADIRVLIDDGIDGHVQPTRVNILQAIAELVKDVEDGDHLVFHYSGHSTQVDNSRSNSEEDGKDECLVPLDGEEMLIVDNELHATLVKPLPAGAHLVAVLDTCHSGSLLDLPHYRCNRVPVPWLSRGKRTSEDFRHWVVRRGARLLSLAGVHTHNASTPAPASTCLHTRRSGSIISVAPPTASRPLTRRHSRRTGSLPPAIPDAEALPALTQMPWILEEQGALRCESPDARFPCTGWCRGAPQPDADGMDMEPAADVISLASCKDSQLAWEDEDENGEPKSMTSSLVEILRENPNRSVKDVLESISHATYNMALARHDRAKAHKCQRKHLVRKIARQIVNLERGARSTASFEHFVPPALAGSRTFPLVGVPTFPLPRAPLFSHAFKPSAVVARVAGRIVRMKQNLRDAAQGGYDMNAFQNPELASVHPLDMDRQWWM
ncbi:caspase domain-containing protein [Mycena vulgaris]|nr:caspase domain-containing protein [Mycena vulgaris]